jgi:hypothetical protein
LLNVVWIVGLIRFLYCLNDEARVILIKIEMQLSIYALLVVLSIQTAYGMVLFFSFSVQVQSSAPMFSNDAPAAPLFGRWINKCLRYYRKVA